MEKKTSQINSGPDGIQSLDTLKNLLIQPEIQRIQSLENRLNDPMVRAREISSTLPEAISLSVLSNKNLARVIQPVVDDSIRSSVEKNPKALADAIFPALGPGIRKAITATIMGMIQSLNQALNHSFSIQGLKWRLEALKTGKPFGEIVLLHTLLYRVEQIFLIHKKSGIVLEHVVTKDVLIQDPDLVSAMLTAIQDFVRDSFTSGEAAEELDSLRMGSDRSVWIEQGEYALLAAVIRGTPPMALRVRYREIIEEIHVKAGTTLSEFNGDPFPFAVFRDQLTQGLKCQEKKESRKPSFPLLILALVLVFYTGFMGFNLYESQQIRQDFLDRLDAQKGLIIFSTRKNNGKYQIQGFKDPLVQDLPEIPQGKGFFFPQIQTHWTPFHSLDPEFVIQRAMKVLNPPQGITLSLSGSRLTARGESSQGWIEIFLAAVIPGISQYDASQIINTDKILLGREIANLETLKIYFHIGSTKLLDGQEGELARTGKIISRIQALQALLKIPVQIMILGHTDSSGTENRNFTLSRERAETVFSLLVINHVSPSLIRFSGIGNRIPLTEETTEEARQLNRAVSFKGFTMRNEND